MRTNFDNTVLIAGNRPVEPPLPNYFNQALAEPTLRPGGGSGAGAGAIAALMQKEGPLTNMMQRNTVEDVDDDLFLLYLYYFCGGGDGVRVDFEFLKFQKFLNWPPVHERLRPHADRYRQLPRGAPTSTAAARTIRSHDAGAVLSAGRGSSRAVRVFFPREWAWGRARKSKQKTSRLHFLQLSTKRACFNA